MRDECLEAISSINLCYVRAEMLPGLAVRGESLGELVNSIDRAEGEFPFQYRIAPVMETESNPFIWGCMAVENAMKHDCLRLLEFAGQGSTDLAAGCWN